MPMLFEKQTGSGVSHLAQPIRLAPPHGLSGLRPDFQSGEALSFLPAKSL